MKGLFVSLLLANLLFIAFIQWGDALTGDSKNLQIQPPLNAEKIKLLPSLVAPNHIAPSPVVPPNSLPAIGVPHMAVQSAVQVADTCMEWGEFSGNILTRATAAMDKLRLGDRLKQRQIEHASGYWAYIPPLKSSADADKKITQLKAFGVEEYSVIQETGKWRNAISLGMFKTDDAAQKFLENIKAKGVKSAKVKERMSKFTLTVFVLRNPDSGMSEKMMELQNEFAGSELKAVACDN